MITPSFNLTATERVLPNLALDFTTASLDPRVTFTRSGNTATRVNSSGYVETINADLPRFDYNPISLACNGLLIEESRTNTCLYSADFRDTADAGVSRPWSYSDVTLSYQPSGVISPNGSANSCTIIESSSTSTHYISQTVANATTSFTISVFAKNSGRRYLRIMLARTAFNSGSRGVATFDLSTGSVTQGGVSVTNIGATTQQFSNGWWRCTYSVTLGAGSNVLIGFFLSDISTSGATLPSYTGDGTSGIDTWGAQLEAASFATSYIPTTASQVTRSADVATMTGTNFSDWYNASEGAFMFQGVNYDVSSTKVIIDVTDGTLNERIQLSTATNKYFMADGGSTQANFGTGSITANTAYKTVAAYKVNDLAFAFNGAATQTDNTATLPTVNQMTIGTRAVFVNTNQYSGWLQKLNYYPQRLTNAEVQAFSK